ncbi:MAG: molybdopterin-binding protein, partial [Thermoplasmata archaeon]
MSESTVAILAIGNEILLGDVVNSNTQWLAKRLRLRGASVVH